MTEADLASGIRASAAFRHIAIAGTGRAGTSFLVRYLTALGMDTSLARDPAGVSWDEDANAGLEQDLASGVAGAMPYIVKSPWLFATIDQVLARRDIALDAVIIPVRNIVEAASSRAIIERQMIHHTAPWMAESSLNWEAWGTTPGGIVYSLNPMDQVRLLAVGFHKLLERLVAAEIPVIFLSFPRFTEDATYLFRTLRPLLPPDIDETRATHVLAELADASKVRVGRELSGAHPQADGAGPKLYEYPTADKIENIALRRELAHLRREADHLRRQCGIGWQRFSWRLARRLRDIITTAWALAPGKAGRRFGRR